MKFPAVLFSFTSAPVVIDCFADVKIIFSLFVLQFCSRISGMRFCEASAKDNFNVDEIFLKLVDDILSKVGLPSVEPDQISDNDELVSDHILHAH